MSGNQVFASSIAIRLERHLPVSPARLWHALTDSAEVTAWMGFPASIGPSLGSRVLIDFNPSNADDALEGSICAFEPDKTFAYTWGDSIVRFEIVLDASTEPDLKFIHSAVAPELAAGLAAGWHGFFDQLQARLTGIPRSSRDADLLAHYKQVYAGFRSTSTR